MKHLIWGIIGTTIGSCFLSGMIFLAHPTLGMGVYGGLFLAYGLYRLKQYRNSRDGETIEPEKDPLQKWNIY